MNLSMKAKCAGCHALQRTNEGYTCLLGCRLIISWLKLVPYAPKPEEKCYKPKGHEQYKQAKRLTDARPIHTHNEKQPAQNS